MSTTKAKRDLGREILSGIRELKKGVTGRVTRIPSVAAIREKAGLSQSEFARRIGISVRTLQDWEQGRRVPSGPARALLLIVEQNPQALRDLAA